MSKHSPLRDYIDEMNDLPVDVLLGRIVVYTITEEQVKRSDLEQWFTELNLDQTFLPHPNKRHDSFKKATKDLDKESYAMRGQRTAHLMCREVNATPDYITRQITREVRDSGRRKLNYDSAITCTFYRPNPERGEDSARLQISVLADQLEPDEVKLVQSYAQLIYKQYEHHYEFMDSQKVRGMVRNYLKKLNAVEIKPGVYYVSCTRDDELTRLSNLVQRLGGGCHMNMIPIVNLKREREFITHVFEREAEQALSALTKEAKELMATRKSITPAMYAKIRERYDEVLANAEEHMLTLEITQDTTAASATVAGRVLEELQNKMLES